MENNIAIELPFLLQEDTGSLTAALATFNRLSFLIGDVRKVYHKLQIGSFDSQAYTATVVNYNFHIVERKLITDVEEKYDSLNLRSTTVRNEVLSGAYDLLEELKRVADNVRNKTSIGYNMPDFPLELISINEAEEPELTKGNEEKLKEKFRVYLRTPAELSIYQKLKGIADAANELMAEIKANKPSRMPYAYNYPPAIAVLLECLTIQEDLLTVVPTAAPSIVASYQQARQVA